MAANMEGIAESNKNKTNEARNKVQISIEELLLLRKPVNFNAISKRSGVSKSFLYSDAETREKIEDMRQHTVNREINQRAKYDKTSKSKDVIIKARERRIAKLEEENRKLRNEVEYLRGRLYEIS
ncbi:MAG: DUF6262 family protein [Defluviitaleaceae bacterium]|nr:DUF6262 family protein [Defluviitaleaceae bacterium]